MKKAAGTKAPEFKVGDRVKVRDSEIDGFIQSFGKRIAGRVGVVRGHLWRDPARVLVTFPKVGRKPEYEAPQINAAHLEHVED